MGCCLSTKKTPPKSKAEAEGISKASLPPPFEEETVKEVLSEVSTPKPSSRNVETQEIPLPSFLKVETDKLSSPPPPSPPPTFPIKLEEDNKMGKKRNLTAEPTVEEISEVSDMCSFSESLSTTTNGEGRVDDGEVRQRVNRSPAKLPKKRPVGGEFTARTERREKMSPARRFDQSPSRRNDNTAMKTSQLHHHHHQNTRDMRGSGSASTNRRRFPEPVEGLGRRSRSPATRQCLGPSPSSKIVRSPGRIPALSPENVRKPGESKVDEGNCNWPTNESLENPLVSLECFIFL